MVLWFCGSVVLWSCGPVVLWFCGASQGRGASCKGRVSEGSVVLWF